jgi:hypothetical protein
MTKDVSRTIKKGAQRPLVEAQRVDSASEVRSVHVAHSTGSYLRATLVREGKLGQKLARRRQAVNAGPVKIPV